LLDIVQSVSNAIAVADVDVTLTGVVLSARAHMRSIVSRSWSRSARWILLRRSKCVRFVSNSVILTL